VHRRYRSHSPFLCFPLWARPLNGQVHLIPDYLSFGLDSMNVGRVSAKPITPEEEIDAVVQQVPDVQ
jgi:hypothetical protein